MQQNITAERKKNHLHPNLLYSPTPSIQSSHSEPAYDECSYLFLVNFYAHPNLTINYIFNCMPLDPTDVGLLASTMEVEQHGEFCAFNFVWLK